MNNANGTPPRVRHAPRSADEARAIMEADVKERREKCQAEIGKVLDKYQCTIDVVVILKTNQVIPQVQIVAR